MERKSFDIQAWADSIRRVRYHAWDFFKTMVHLGRVVDEIKKLELPQDQENQIFEVLKQLGEKEGLDMEDLWDAEAGGYIRLERDKSLSAFMENFSERVLGKPFSELTPSQRQEAEYMITHFWDFDKLS